MASTQRRLVNPAEVASRRWERQKSHANTTYRAFLQELAREPTLVKDSAEPAATAVVCALEQHLLPQERRDFEAQLPTKLRDRVRQCEVDDVQTRPRRFGRKRFLQIVADHLGTSADEVEPTIRAVLSVLSRRVSRGEIEDVLGELPADVRALWPHDVAGKNGTLQEVLDAIRHLGLEEQKDLLRSMTTDTMRRLDPEARRQFWWQLSRDAVDAERSAR